MSKKKPTTPKKKRPPKTIKERKFLKKYLETGNATQSAFETYDVKDLNTASSLGAQTLRKLSIGELMDKRGLTDDRLLETLEDGLQATKVISATIIAGNPKEAGSQTNDFIDVPDHNARHRYLETGLRLKGYGQQMQVVAILLLIIG